MTRNICVFCGSSSGKDPVHIKLAREVGERLAASDIRLIYGGGGLGLMGAVARSAHEHGGKVLGVIPKFLQEAERALTIVEHVYVEDMHERKIRMYEEADAFIVLPGGIGTLEETVEILSWVTLNLHEKPLVFLAADGYWDGFTKLFRDMIKAGFIKKSFERDIMSTDDAQTALDIIEDRIANPIERIPLNLSNPIGKVV